MAHTYDEGVEGTSTSPASIQPTLKQWLADNRVSKLLPYLTQEEVEFADLLTYTESEISAMWESKEVQEMGVKFTIHYAETAEYICSDIQPFRYCIPYMIMQLGPLYKGRFMKAWRKLQFEASKSGKTGTAAASSGSNVFGQVHRIVISAEEQSAINEMESKVKELDEILKEITNQQSELTEDSKKKEMEIKETFNVFRNQLDDREKILTAKLSAETKRVGEELKTKENALKKYHETGSAALDQQNALILDPSIDSKKREIKIKEITNEAMQGMDDEHFQIGTHPILFSVDNDAVKKFIAAIGEVSAQPNAPKLTISEISAFGAKVGLSTQDEKGEICYVVRYRKTIGNDDEKEEEWKEQEMEQNSDSMVINGLQSASKYEICGRYQVKKTSVWSRLSKITAFTTLKRPSFEFEFDPDRCHSDCVLSNGNKTVTKKNGGSWTSVYSKTMISTATMSSCKWQITIRQKGSNGLMMMGIMDAKYIESANTGTHIAGQHQFSVQIFDNYYPRRFINGNHSNIQSNYVKWNIGDRLRLDFDLKGRRCTVFLNDQLLGSLTDDLPETFYLGVCNHRNGTVLETTLFESV